MAYQSIKNLFQSLKELEPQENLRGRILATISREKNRQLAERKLTIIRTGLAASVVMLVYTLAIFGETFWRSSFFSLLKLLFSDTGVILEHFGSFSISLLEALPVFELFVMLVPIFVLMMMLIWYFKFADSNHYNKIITN